MVTDLLVVLEVVLVVMAELTQTLVVLHLLQVKVMLVEIQHQESSTTWVVAEAALVALEQVLLPTTQSVLVVLVLLLILFGDALLVRDKMLVE
jgi:uncharacterized membrane protein YhhN